MNRATTTTFFFVLTLLGVAILGTGCLPSRDQYFGQLDNRRSRSFRRWEQQKTREELEKPTLEGPLSLEDVVRVTLSYNTQIAAIYQEKERARGRIISAYSEALPSVDLSANYTRLDRIQTVDLGVESFPIGAKDNYSTRVDITQPLYKGGSIRIAQRAARIFSYLSDEKVRGTVENMLFKSAKAYFDARLAEHMIEVQEAALESAEQHLDDVKSKHKHGTATEYDVLRARVDVSNIRADLIQQRNSRDQATTELMRAMGASQRSDVRLTTDMEYAKMSPDFIDSVEEAFDNRPDIYQAELDIDLQNARLQEAYSRYWPRLNANFWQLWARPDPHETTRIKWGDQWEAGISLNWALFDGLAREGRIIEQRAMLRQNEIQLVDTEEQAIQEVRNAILELQNARELVESQQLNLKRADRALQLVRSGYKEGVNTAVEVLDARTALTEARGLYYRALHRHILARIDLQKAKGLLGPAPGTDNDPDEETDSTSILTTNNQTDDMKDETPE